MDSIIDSSKLPILSSKDHYIRNARLLTVFGCNAEEVIFITKDDEVYGYGRNRFGGLGLGHTVENKETPELNVSLTGKRVVNIFCGYEHWIALTASGKCYAWGHNQFGQLGIRTAEQTATPQLIEALKDQTVVNVSCGASHTMVVTSDGQLLVFGSNKSGQLGDGTRGWRATPTKISLPDKPISISSGKNHCLAITESGSLYGWGFNGYGQLAHNGKQNLVIYSPKLIPGLEAEYITKAICGPNYSLVMTIDGNVYAFGENTCGQIGNGSTDNQFTPHKVEVDVKFQDIICHKENDISMAVSFDDHCYVWGLVNNRRQSVPKAVDSCGQSLFDIYIKYAKSKLTFKTITTYDKLSLRRPQGTNGTIDNETNGTYRRISPSTVKNSFKQLKTLDDFIDPILFPAIYWTLFDDKIRSEVRMIRVFGKSANKVIFATNSDKVYGYGFNRDWSLGLGITDERIRKPVLNQYLSYKQLIDVSPGFEHCIGLTADGKCYSWGQNKYGELGVGDCVETAVPKLIEDLVDVEVKQICCGCYHSMALTSDGDLFSWGHNTFAQLGDHTYNSRSRPTQVLIPGKVKDISCGFYHCMALTESGEVYIWGNNTAGQLGRDPKCDNQRGRLKPMSSRPLKITFPDNVIVKAVCGSNHNLILSNDGNVFVFGENTCGQIGNGTLLPQHKPLKLEFDVKIKDIITNFENDQSVAVSVNNKCYIWGSVCARNILKPELKQESTDKMLNVLAKYGTYKMMFKTLVVNSMDDVIAGRGQRTEENFESEFQFTDVTDLMKQNTVNDRKHLEEVVDIKLFPVLKSNHFNEIKNNIRLLNIYGPNGSKVIFITNDDNVFAFGDNSDGCLGLDTEEKYIEKPTLNRVLSGQNLIDIVCGEQHCIGLTSSGKCYAWGENNHGQLGIGKDWYSRSPRLIEELANQIVTQVNCGAHHTMALTKIGQVFAFGRNDFAQLGDRTVNNRLVPKHIPIKHRIASISCGANHSMALIDFGLLYIWGNNEFGQLARHRDYDRKPSMKKYISLYPAPNIVFKNVQFIKAVCGANHVLLLTTDGNVYASGANSFGQIGCDTTELQFNPIRINKDILFKDIFTHFSNELSVGVSVDGHKYVWGLANNEKVLIPRLVKGSSDESIFNVYAKFAKNKVTIKSVIIGSSVKNHGKIIQIEESKPINKVNLNTGSSDKQDNFQMNESVPLKTQTELLSDKIVTLNTSVSDTNKTNSSWNQWFNNSSTSDIKFKCNDKEIHCHKKILEIRNKKFWQTVSERMVGNEIAVIGDNYEVFHAFLQYMYGLEPEITRGIVEDLQTMAKYFCEPQLAYLCSQYIKFYDMFVDVSNVCSLYEKAINEELPDLEKSCVEFAANHWKEVVKSMGFEVMDASIAKLLMCSVFSRK